MFTVIPLIKAPAGKPVKVYVPVGLAWSVPDAVIVPELAVPVPAVAFVEAFIATICPEHNAKSEPAFTVVAWIPVPDAATFCVVAPVLDTTMFPENAPVVPGVNFT
jgi:hypothetical protein